MERIRLFDVHDENGLVLEGGFRVNRSEAYRIMKENLAAAYWVEQECLRNQNGFVVHTYRTVQFYTRQEFEFDVKVEQVIFHD